MPLSRIAFDVLLILIGLPLMAMQTFFMIEAVIQFFGDIANNMYR